MHNFFYIFIAFFFVLLNGFFVAAEFAMVKMRQTRVDTIKAMHGVKGRILSKIHAKLDAYLSACQLGITLASLGLGWIGEPAFARLLQPLLNSLAIFSPTVITGVSFIIAFLFIAFLHIVLGELAPKSMAIRRPETVSLWSAPFLYCFYWMMYPIIWILNGSANLILQSLGINSAHEVENSYSAEELKLILDASHAHGQMPKEEMEILEQALDFADLNAADVMRPADELISLNIADPLDINLNKIITHHYSRYPIYKEELSNFIGIVHVKDLFAHLHQNNTITDLNSYLRPLLKVPRDMTAMELFQQFRLGFSHFATVHNDNGGLIGFVTLDNILGSLFGHIRDEFNKTQDDWIKTKDGAYLMKGNLSLYALEKALDIDINIEGVDTISGLLLAKLERLPTMNERVSFEHCDIEVRKMKGPRILLVKIYPKIHNNT